MKKILGPNQQLQLEPFEYPVFYEILKAQIANNWTPEEIGVGQDIVVYKKLQKSTDLTDKSMLHWFNGVLAQLTTFDMLRAEDATTLLLHLIEPEEIRQFLIRLQWEEVNHTLSYKYIIQNFGIPETGPYSIYEMWQYVPELRARVDYANEETQPLRSLVSAKWQENDWRGNKIALQSLLRSMIFWFLIFEKIWFLINLNGPIQWFAKQRKFVAAAEQFTYISRDECCVQGTEVLTPQGWLPIEQVTLETSIAQWHKDGTLSWTCPVTLSSHDATAAIEFKHSRGMHQLVSENHRFPYYTKDWKLKVVPATEAKPNPYSTHPVAAPLRESENETPIDAEELFLIALQADGSLPDDKHTGAHSGCRPVTFSFAKPRKYNRMLEILARLQWKHTITLGRKKGNQRDQSRFRVSVPLGDTPLTKNFSDWVFNRERTLTWWQQFIDEVAVWDGHINKENESRITYSSINKNNVDVVQAAAALCGYRTKYTLIKDERSETFSDVHRLFINKHQWWVAGGQMTKEVKQGNFKMYGVQVPSSFMLIRYNNCVSITGNSQHIRGGVELIRAFVREHPETITDEFLSSIQKMYEDALDLELKFVNYCARTHPIVGYSTANHIETARVFANLGARASGFIPDPFPNARHRFPWMGDQETKQERNFFETRVIEYQAGADLGWEEGETWDDGMFDHLTGGI